jgi:hypothetical protein
MDPAARQRAIGGFTSRLKFPQLLAVTATLFVLDLLVPDLIPFADEILLGLATALFALWREQVPEPPAPEKPAERDVTPRDAGGAPLAGRDPEG